MDDPTIKSASTMTEYRFTTISHETEHTIRNTNSTLLANKFNFLSSKTGYLDEAGYCLMTAIETPAKKKMIVVILGASDKAVSRTENENLLFYGLKNIE